MQKTRITDPKLAQSMQEEGRELSAFIMQRFPWLRRAYVMLNTFDEGVVDLRVDRFGGYESVPASEAHLAPLEQDPQATFFPEFFNSSCVLSATPSQVLDAVSPASDSEASVDSDCSSESSQTVTDVLSPVDTYFQSSSLEGCLLMELS